MRRLAIAIAVGATALLSLPAIAQDEDAEVEDDGRSTICLTVARGWGGTREDLLRIRDNPVPISFRRTYESTGCARFQLIESSLLSWHLAYGDEVSATGAIEYLEEASLKEPLNPETLPAQLSERVDQAWPSLVKGNALRAAGEHEAFFKFKHFDPDLQRLYELTNAVYQHRFLADSWLRASRFYNSATMLERARPHMEVVLAFDAFLKSIEERQAQIPSMRIEPFEDYELEFSMLERRYRVQRGLLLGDLDGLPPDRFGVRREDAEYQLEQIFQSGIDLQELNELNQEDFEEVIERLDQDQWFASITVRSWREEVLADYARAMHTEISQIPTGRVCDSRQRYKAIQGLMTMEREGHSYGDLRGYSPSSFTGSWRDDQLTLLLAQVACYRAVADKSLEGGNPGAMFDYLRQAIYTLSQARQLVQPDESPGRFRQIAQSYLDVGDQCREMSLIHAGGVGSCYSYETSLAAYFKANLAALDYIAYGAEGVENE